MSRPLAPGLLALAVVLSPSCTRGLRPGEGASLPPRPLALVPWPASVEIREGRFVLSPESVIVVPAGDEQAAFVGRFIAGAIATASIPPPPVVEGAGPVPERSIWLSTDASDLPFEHYTLAVSPSGVRIRARDAAGLFYGAQTLRQLLPAELEHKGARPAAVSISSIHVADGPRFPWRGAMLDVARHFFEVDDVKRYVDLMVLHKLNRLHLHLSDDQGWRIEIESWPNLSAHGGSTEVGGGPGGFYTRAQYAEIVSYARDRFVTVVPEIDMPGHVNAALASYPELNCDGKPPPLYTGIEVGFSALCVTSETTYRFIDDVVREISALTPGPYFHVGGDEVKALSPDQYRRFIERVQDIVRSHGKQMIGWDEIAPAALHPTSIVQHWRPGTTPREAVEKGARLILSPAHRVYLDMKYHPSTPIGQDWAATIEVRDAYEWEPAALLPGVPERALLGVEAPLWSETAATMRDVELLAFPRLAAVAELAWSAPHRRPWNDFAARLGAQARRWAALGINFERSSQIRWQH